MMQMFWYKIKYFQRWWRWRFLGFCPNCNSDAPNMYDCDVCDNISSRDTKMYRASKIYWWNRFMNKVGWTGLLIGRFNESKFEKPFPLKF